MTAVHEWLPTLALLISASLFVIDLKIKNQSLKDKVERLEQENERLREYASVSKP